MHFHVITSSACTYTGNTRPTPPALLAPVTPAPAQLLLWVWLPAPVHVGSTQDRAPQVCTESMGLRITGAAIDVRSHSSANGCRGNLQGVTEVLQAAAGAGAAERVGCTSRSARDRKECQADDVARSHTRWALDNSRYSTDTGYKPHLRINPTPHAPLDLHGWV
jgi:hypothetical protein